MSQKSIPNAGTYADCKCPAGTSLVLYETEGGAICVAVPVEIGPSEISWIGKHTVTLFKSDGEMMTRNVDTIKRVFGWDGVSLEAIDKIDVSEMRFECVGEHEDFQPRDGSEARTIFKIQFLNPIGGSTNMPERLDDSKIKSLQTRFGSKLKAQAGATGKSATSTASTQAPKDAKEEKKTDSPPGNGGTSKAASSGPPGRRKSNATTATKRTMTADEVWDALSKRDGKGKTDKELEKLGDDVYWPAAKKVGDAANPPTEPENLSPAQWGEVADALGL